MKKQMCMLLAGLLLCGCANTAVLPDNDTSKPVQTQQASVWDTEPDSVPVFVNGTQSKAVKAGDKVWLDCDMLDDVDVQTLTCAQLQDGDTLNDCDTAAVLYNTDGSTAETWISLDTLTEQFAYRTLYDEQQQVYYVSSKPNMTEIPAGKNVPVLMYHAVSDTTWGLEGLFMSPDSMREQLKYLTENGYDPIFFSDLTHLEDYDKPVILTFDDGYADNYSELFPLLQEFQVKATIFVITDVVDVNSKFMTSEQVRELSDSGLVDIESHTASHNELASLSRQEQEIEMNKSQLAIARMTGRIPYVLSYPSGKYNDDTLQLDAGYYDFAVRSRGNLWTTTDDFFEIARYPVYRNLSLSGFEAFVQGK